MSIDQLIKYRKYPILNRIVTKIISLRGIDMPLGVKLGNNVSFRHNASGTVIHNSTTIGNDVKIYQNVTIGRADVHISPEKSKMKAVIIKDGAILSAGAKILCKEGTLVVGRNSIIAANAVLLNSVGENEIWGGIPAKKIGVVEGK